MVNGVARDQLRAIVDRILRLKEEQDNIGADIRECYAEAKANGYDKTALGQVIGIIRRRDRDPAGYEHRSAIVDLYLSTLCVVGTADATRTHAHEEFDPATGEVIADRPASRGAAHAAPPARSADESGSPPTIDTPLSERGDAQPEGGITAGSRPGLTDDGFLAEDIPEHLRRVA